MKVAYLIIAHNELSLLNTLIPLLDWPGNSIHILIDSKSGIRRKDIFTDIHYSSIKVHKPGINITWGGSSMIDGELYLLSNASLESVDYYCLLSGVDLPIKTQSFIHDLLIANQDVEYVGIHNGWLQDNNRISRYNVYHPMQNIIGRKRNILWMIEKTIIDIQKPFVNRQRTSSVAFEGGPQWFCITHAFCKYILSKAEWIRKTFKYTRCCDEVFIQTLLLNSGYYGKLYKPKCNCYEQCCRLIEFESNGPYIWRTSDYDRIMNSDAWFARKFSESVDMNIVNMISEKIGKEQERILSTVL